MNTNVDVDAMRKDAVEIFQKGFVFVVRLQEQPCASAIFSEEEHLEMKPF